MPRSHHNRVAAPTLKGAAVKCAIEAGLCPPMKDENGEDGYNIAPFLRFWEAFERDMLNSLQPRKRPLV